MLQYFKLNLVELSDEDDLNDEVMNQVKVLGVHLIQMRVYCVLNIGLNLRIFLYNYYVWNHLIQTLTDLEKRGIEEQEWLSIIFQLCFGLAGAQKHLGFIHNDLHSDNIMFKNTDKEYNYFKYENIFLRLPTFGREMKIIDFARSIFKIKNNIYYSDVFERNGDAGGQYGNPPSVFFKKKN